MPLHEVEQILSKELVGLDKSGTRKGRETVITTVLPPKGDRGPRYLLEGEGDRPFLRMNSNGYLGMALRREVIAAEEKAVRAFGTGPAAVRFISGTFEPHIDLERRLAAFHGRQAGMIFSSAYATVMGALSPLVTSETAVISDELNHNCIINATRLARPREKYVYRHLDMGELEASLERAARTCQRGIVVTDGVFSMRGDHAPLRTIVELARRYDERFPENVLVMVDDSHGIGALGTTGRGTEEYTRSGPVDVLVATLGKALGVNGGYVVTSGIVVDYLREKAPFYIYSNPITPAEAAAAAKALDLLDAPTGRALLDHLRRMTKYFEQGLIKLGYETIPGEHPVVPLMVRDTAMTIRLTQHLRKNGILATGLSFPVVPRGDEEIRFQISADHTQTDLEEALRVLAEFPDRI